MKENTINQKDKLLESDFNSLSAGNIADVKNILVEMSKYKEITYKIFQSIIRKYPKSDKSLYKKTQLLDYYYNLKKHEKIDLSENEEKNLLNALVTKKTRSISGITPVTVLTKPYPCPGKCIFCPNDVRMPKSYLSDEPGAQRAEKNKFDPYLQTYNRLVAFAKMGHSTDKIELIILGGTWTSYPKSYQIWFVKRCFDALNDFDKNNYNPLNTENELPYDQSKLEQINGENINKTYNQVVSTAIKDREKENTEKSSFEELEKAQQINESSNAKCVGLVIETRPDEITHNSVTHLRVLGTTKIQIGIQHLDDKVLALNKRGHDSSVTKNAINLLRQAGFKIHAHWMPNLYGSNTKKDLLDYKKVFSDPNIKPDEIKIYPCSLISSAELMQYYKKGLWQPYFEKDLIELLVNCYSVTPKYCRITRLIRDISSDDIVVGNKKTNLREIVELEMKKRKINSEEIRIREIKDTKYNPNELIISEYEYQTKVSKEIFIECTTKGNKIVGFLRLSIPKTKPFIEELENSTIIREIHVYGQSLEVGKYDKGKSQHLGLGKKLIKKGQEISKKHGYKKMAVISAIGTKEYYRKNGFYDGKLYQHKDI